MPIVVEDLSPTPASANSCPRRRPKSRADGIALQARSVSCQTCKPLDGTLLRRAAE